LVDGVHREAEPVEKLGHLLARAARAAAVEASGVQHVLPRAQLLEERGLDRDTVHVPAHRQWLGDHVPAEHHRLARVRREQRAEDPDERRLAASVGSEDAGDSSRLDDEVQLVEGNLVLPVATPPGRAGFALAAPKGFGNALQPYCCCCHCLITPLECGGKQKDRAVPNGRTVPFGGLFLEVFYRNRLNVRSREGTPRHRWRSEASQSATLVSPDLGWTHPDECGDPVNVIAPAYEVKPSWLNTNAMMKASSRQDSYRPEGPECPAIISVCRSSGRPI
jgi:hypothetical protein